MGSQRLGGGGASTWGTAIAFLRPKFDGTGIVSSPTKTVALPLNADVPTAEDISLLLNVDVRNA